MPAVLRALHCLQAFLMPAVLTAMHSAFACCVLAACRRPRCLPPCIPPLPMLQLLAFLCATTEGDSERPATASDDAPEIPWDCKGPLPSDPGICDPTERWKGQVWRPGSQRWGNRGGKDRELYAVWHEEGRHRFFHPKAGNGYSPSFAPAAVLTGMSMHAVLTAIA